MGDPTDEKRGYVLEAKEAMKTLEEAGMTLTPVQRCIFEEIYRLRSRGREYAERVNKLGINDLRGQDGNVLSTIIMQYNQRLCDLEYVFGLRDKPREYEKSTFGELVEKARENFSRLCEGTLETSFEELRQEFETLREEEFGKLITQVDTYQETVLEACDQLTRENKVLREEVGKLREEVGGYRTQAAKALELESSIRTLSGQVETLQTDVKKSKDKTKLEKVEGSVKDLKKEAKDIRKELGKKIKIEGAAGLLEKLKKLEEKVEGHDAFFKNFGEEEEE